MANLLFRDHGTYVPFPIGPKADIEEYTIFIRILSQDILKKTSIAVNEKIHNIKPNKEISNSSNRQKRSERHGIFHIFTLCDHQSNADSSAEQRADKEDKKQ